MREVEGRDDRANLIGRHVNDLSLAQARDNPHGEAVLGIVVKVVEGCAYDEMVGNDLTDSGLRLEFGSGVHIERRGGVLFRKRSAASRQDGIVSDIENA